MIESKRFVVLVLCCVFFATAVALALSALLKRRSKRALNKSSRSLAEIRQSLSSIEHAVEDERIGLISLPEFLTPDECERLIELADKTGFRRSQVTVSLGKSAATGHRTSATCYLPRGTGEGSPVDAAEERVAALLGIGRGQIEPLQVVRYAQGQEFKEHHDWFHQLLPGESQRQYTVFVYLNTLPPGAGGETVFSKLGRSFSPVAGTALLWENCPEQNDCHDLTLHQGRPPARPDGVKYGLNIWTRFPAP